MAYTKNATWVDYPDTSTLVTAAKLNNIEDGIESAASTADGAIPKSLVDAKGDLLVATAADTVARLPVGATTGHVLTVDPAEAAGMKWAAGGGGSDPWTYYVVAGDVGNNTTTYATITGLSVPAGLAAGQYEVRVMLTGTSASGGLTVGVDRPNNSRSDGYQSITISTANISRKWIAGTGPGISADSEFTSTHAATYQTPLYEASFILTVTATTTSALSVAHKAATAGSNIVIKPGSYLAIRRISA